MNYLVCLRFPSFVLFALALLCTPLSRAEEPSQAARDDQPLVVADGNFTHQGQTGPATLRRVVEALRVRYSNANINLVGVEEVPIKNLVLHWATQREPAPAGEIGRRVNPPLESVLAAVAEAAGNQVEVRNFGPHNFLLRLSSEFRHHNPSSRTEVFNLSAFFPQRRDSAELTSKLRELQLRLSIGEKTHTPEHPHITGLRAEMELITALLAENPRPSDDVIKQLVEKIQEVVQMTLAAQTSDAKPPVFQFHAGTNLLIATGSGQAIQVTQQVLAAMREKR